MTELCLSDRETLCNEAEAKGCPFCGQQPTKQPWHGGGPRKRMISCVNVDCEVSPMVTGSTLKTALSNWNGRVDG